MKRKLLGLVVGILLISAILPAVGIYVHEEKQVKGENNGELTQDDDWTMFRHDSSHSGYSASTAPNTNTLIWNHTIGGVDDSSPAVVDDRVYIGSRDKKVYCLNATTGKQVWNYTTEGYVRSSSPAVVDGRVYFGSWDTNVYCLNAETGEQIWSYTTDGWIRSSPAVADGKVFIGSYDKKVYCLNAETGEQIWSYTTDGWIRSSPAVDDDRVYVSSWDKNVYCLYAINGTKIWNYTTGGWVQSSPAVADGRVYFGSSDGAVYCLNAIDGSYIWEYTAQFTGDWTSPAVAYGKVYLGDSMFSGSIHCLNATDGSYMWDYTRGEIGNGWNTIRSSPAVADGKVYIGSDKVHCLDAENGEELWNYLPSMAGEEDYWLSSPAVADGRVYIAEPYGNVYCFGELNQPNKPTISGPTAGGPEIELRFSAVYADPEGGQIYYLWDWGDGNFSEWLGPFDSNESVTTNYSWVNNGEYEIQVKAKDINDEESNWSEPHNISIATQIELSNLQLGFIYLRTFFANNSYAYIYLLETLGVSVVLSDEGLCAEATATDAVDSVTFELIDLLWEDQINQEDDNSSDGFSTHFEIPSSLLQITVYAYDENGTMIDIDKLDYLVFIDLTSGDESQQIGPICKIGYRLKGRFRDRVLHR